MYDKRFELKLILSKIFIDDDRPGEYQAGDVAEQQRINSILACLREFDRIPLARPWKVSPPPVPERKP